MKKYAASAYARQRKDGAIVTEHCPYIITAENEDEATGMAYKRTLEKWPKEEGWTAHSVVIIPTDVNEEY